MNSQLFQINLKELFQAALTAIVASVVLVVYKLVTAPGFDVFLVDWTSLGQSLVNSAISAFVGVIGLKFISNSDGKVMGGFNEKVKSIFGKTSEKDS